MYTLLECCHFGPIENAFAFIGILQLQTYKKCTFHNRQNDA